MSGASGRSARRLRGAAAVVRALEDEQVPFTFGIPGTHNIELYDRLHDSSVVTPVLVTDEQSASFMADGLWRATGKLGCVNLVPGAGFTHALSGIAEAFLDNVPMLVLGCGIRDDVDLAWQLHDIDQAALAAPVTKAVLHPRRPSDIYDAIRSACTLAREGAPGPVMVEIPANLYLRPHHDPAAEGPDAAVATSPEEPAALASDGRTATRQADREPPREEIERAARVLLGSHRTLLYLGRGAAGAGASLVRLAEILEAPVATTLQGKGVFPETHPLALWPGFGEAAPSFARRIAARCGATLAIGCRFSEVGTGSYGLRPPGTLVHVDIDPAVPGRNFRAQVAIVADATDFVPALVERLAAARGPNGRPDLELREQIREGKAGVREEALQSSGVGGVNPARLLEALQERLGAGTVFATDSGNGTFIAAESLQLDAVGRFLAPIDYSCMGYAVPAAIGAALGAPGTPVVALAGDGAFLMTGLEMLTAVQLAVPVACIVLRDGELAQIAQFQHTAYARKVCSAVPDYALEPLCRGLGLELLTLEADDRIHEVVNEVGRTLEQGRPVAVAVRIDYSRRTHFTRGVVRTNFGRLPWRDRLRVAARAVSRRLSR